MKYMKIMEDTNHAATIYRQCEGCAFTCRKTARKLQQGYVGTEHILIGLLKEGNGVAAKVLFQNGVDENRLWTS